MFFLLKYIKYYQTRQIGVGPRMDFQQIGTVDTEWLYSNQTQSVVPKSAARWNRAPAKREAMFACKHKLFTVYCISFFQAAVIHGPVIHPKHDMSHWKQFSETMIDHGISWLIMVFHDWLSFRSIKKLTSTKWLSRLDQPLIKLD